MRWNVWEGLQRQRSIILGKRENKMDKFRVDDLVITDDGAVGIVLKIENDIVFVEHKDGIFEYHSSYLDYFEA